MVKDLVEHLVISLVDKSSQVRVTEVEVDSRKSVVQVHVAAQDLGRIIGGDGRMFRALRTVINAVEPQRERDLVVDIAE